ncbi:MFS transporter [Candidatus Finniella inopinata]|uniref:MFS transporter n=1 Tax=Candidatus Finniella inopinata TaxID=1696036 RepID=A0A4Q7DIM1_9PROT|nr:MFS transporter [Candidatus Finniella inopinata]RZI46200.1 MFS transporter [Candidatus Finniella inopinata]
MIRVFKGLSRQQKESIGLLQIGTFLEYFDLMLYVHMAVLLNELFFPEADPHTTAVVSAFAFCSTFILRPFGAILFGLIGDNIGRKSTVIMTTMMMALSCIVMANLPTYAEIGISAAWIITICRIAQGLSSMGEVMGAQIYITEITKPPTQYFAVTLIVFSLALGGMTAVGIASLVTHFDFNWRVAFWIGACVAVVGTLARTRLRETPEFLEMKRRKKQNEENDYKHENRKKTAPEKISKKNLIAYFFIECTCPMVFYLAYIYFNPLLKTLGLSSANIIFHNFLVTISELLFTVFLLYFVTKFHPLKILRFKAICAVFFILALPACIMYSTSAWHIFIIQALIFLCPIGGTPGDAIFFKSFPTSRRFMSTTFAYASSRAIMHIISAFGLVYLTEWFGYYGIWFIGLPIIGAFFWALNHFEKLEGLRPNKSSNPDLGGGYIEAA